MRVPLGSVCSGYGGLELGISMVIPVETRWVADYEPPTEKHPNPKQGPSIILAHRFPGVPNLGDITTADWPRTGRVKIVCGGTPCQDVSAAGARAGMRAGTRSGIWSSMVQAIEHHRPTLVVWENVRGALSAQADSGMEPCPICLGDERECNLRALGRVLGDLSELGYDAVWQVVSAASVGAPHRRDRVFVVAWPADPDRDAVRVEPIAGAGGGGPAGAGDPAENPDIAAGGERRKSAPGQAPGGRSWPDAGRSDRARVVADPDGQRPPGESRCGPAGGEPDASGGGHLDWGPFADAIQRWERVLGRVAPRPTELSTRGGQVLAPAFVEWMMGLPVGWVTGVPGLTRADQLKALGNGVVPLQAASAVGGLLDRAPVWVRESLGLPRLNRDDPGLVTA